MSEGCTCNGMEGEACPRFPHKRMNAHLRELCQTRADYRELWDRQANGKQPCRPIKIALPVISPELEHALWPGPRQKILQMTRPLRCRHLGEIVRENGRPIRRTYVSH